MTASNQSKPTKEKKDLSSLTTRLFFGPDFVFRALVESVWEFPGASWHVGMDSKHPKLKKAPIPAQLPNGMRKMRNLLCERRGSTEGRTKTKTCITLMSSHTRYGCFWSPSGLSLLGRAISKKTPNQSIISSRDCNLRSVQLDHSKKNTFFNQF